MRTSNLRFTIEEPFSEACLRIPEHPDIRSDSIRTGIPGYPVNAILLGIDAGSI